ncbi:hypothetical protein L227DRAFT_400466 [Lentinus tigrinus ALCF2SS1-6]|uniref:Uncharacterized protein n=1 Tax=Lentinus tigrinus ALCF2SS1-6 TaxID=1328759 RepID=A0A5C2RS91_9APHY|nr:hypothetical protein L227DRAFT_400466 [Lentinus tigrinus ALCF2SS1-6]
MAAKKRKETPQSSTLLDFFGGKSTSSNTRNVKKARLAGKKSIQVKREVPDEVIVIDSSEEDDVVEVAILPSDTKEHRGEEDFGRTSPILANFSTNVKCEPTEDQDGVGLSESSLSFDILEPQDDQNREPSPFGFPTMLAVQGQSEPELAVPPKAAYPGPFDCSHDGTTTVASPPLPTAEDASQVEDALLGAGEWGMGDDEMELCGLDPEVKAEESDSVDIDLTVDTDPEVKAEDSSSVDLDLTLEDDDDCVPSGKEQPAESCPICEKELAGMSTVVRPYT